MATEETMATHQLVFTGHVRIGVATYVEQESIERIKSRCHQLSLGGRMLYAAGNYLLILEGERPNLQTMFEAFANHPSMDEPMILLDDVAERRYFEDFTIGYLSSDIDQPITEPVLLNKLGKESVFPEELPNRLMAFVDSFYKVQQVD